MAYFECVIGSATGGGSGADLIVTCDSAFAGVTITCTDGNTTFTETCPSASPYTVTFESIPTGTWTISGVVSGQTHTTTKTITDFSTTLNAIPVGATVTPTDDIQTWLHCANIWDKTYTTISQVLNDATTVTALIASNNAADYMARSTTWDSSVVANSSAMTKIGANNYCADKLLANSTWRTAICNSTYFESVLNVKVPTMTSATAPSGTVIANGSFSGQPAYQAFDNNDTTSWSSDVSTYSTAYIGYTFTSNVKCYMAKFTKRNLSTTTYNGNCTAKYQVSSNGTSYTDTTETLSFNQLADSTGVKLTHIFSKNFTSAKYYRLKYVTGEGEASGVNPTLAGLQFYGRA